MNMAPSAYSYCSNHGLNLIDPPLKAYSTIAFTHNSIFGGNTCVAAAFDEAVVLAVDILMPSH
jgi:hypothetical protein